jgi:hypothetical protein
MQPYQPTRDPGDGPMVLGRDGVPGRGLHQTRPKARRPPGVADELAKAADTRQGPLTLGPDRRLLRARGLGSSTRFLPCGSRNRSAVWAHSPNQARPATLR